MITFITKTNQTIDIRIAENEDIDAIQNLNKKWTVESLNILEKENGFLFCDLYKKNDLQKIIFAKELAVATFENKIIAYYINDNYSTLLSESASAINEMKKQNIISTESRVSLRTQIVVEKEFHRMGIPKAILSFLKPYLVNKFDLLFSIGINENPKKIAHQKAGWKIIFENEENYYCIYDLKE